MVKNIFIATTFHPAAKETMKHFAKKYKIFYYNYYENDRKIPENPSHEFTDLKLKKIRLKKFDLSITNTLPIFFKILKIKPKTIVTEDYLFALPYIIAAKIIKAKLIFYNSNTSYVSTRFKLYLIAKLKSFLLSFFDEFWHGFHGAENYVKAYLNVESKLIPWVRINKTKFETIDNSILRGLYVGEFNKRKRINKIIAFYDYINKYKKTKLFCMLVGCPETSSYFKTHFKERNSSDVLKLMKKSHYLMLLSQREPMGAVVIESLVNGLFVILSKEVGSKSFVELEPSVSPTPHGVIHFNYIGCIIDINKISIKNLTDFIISQHKLISHNRNKRVELMKEYLVK
jgi:hypothetical protein